MWMKCEDGLVEIWYNYIASLHTLKGNDNFQYILTLAEEQLST